MPLRRLAAGLSPPRCEALFAEDDLGNALAVLNADLDGISHAGSVAETAAMAQAFRHHLSQLAVLNDSPLLLARLLTTLCDRCTQHLLTLAMADGAGRSLPAQPWCWLALGAQGRNEMVPSSDQDNALVFLANDAAEARTLSPLFQSFATQINEGLAACGFSLCQGGVMASQADCCLSLNDWQDRFNQWVHTPEPEALLKAVIFFDFRPVHGDPSLADALRRHLFSLTRDNSGFLRMLARNALDVTPPLAPLGGLSNDHVDLKIYGTRLFVDAARILALDQGIPAMASSDRLAACLPEQDARAAIAAYHLIQGQRLQHQHTTEPDNVLDTRRLSRYEYRQLREAMEQARTLQSLIDIRYCRTL